MVDQWYCAVNDPSLDYSLGNSSRAKSRVTSSGSRPEPTSDGNDDAEADDSVQRSFRRRQEQSLAQSCAACELYKSDTLRSSFSMAIWGKARAIWGRLSNDWRGHPDTHYLLPRLTGYTPHVT